MSGKISRRAAFGLGELIGGAPCLAIDGIGGSVRGATDGEFRLPADRSFEGQDCVVRARLQQMDEPNSLILVLDAGITLGSSQCLPLRT